MDQTSPFRRITPSCPRCHSSLSFGEPAFCSNCRGAWISEQALVERVATMQRAPAELDWTTEARAPIPCLACREPMEPLVVFDVAIDRCRSHGFWFDGDELRQVLHASSVRPKPERVASGAPSDVGVADVALGAVTLDAGSVAATGAAEVAVEAAIGTGEVAAEVAGGILEAIGELLGGLL